MERFPEINQRQSFGSSGINSGSFNSFNIPVFPQCKIFVPCENSVLLSASFPERICSQGYSLTPSFRERPTRQEEYSENAVEAV